MFRIYKYLVKEQAACVLDVSVSESNSDYLHINFPKILFRLLLCRAVHNWPESSKLRRALALFYLHFENLQTDNRNAETVARCAEIASGLGRNESEAVEMACLVGVGRTLSNNSDSGLRAAIKVAHTYPGSPEAWSVLVSSKLNLRILKFDFSL